MGAVDIPRMIPSIYIFPFIALLVYVCWTVLHLCLFITFRLSFSSGPNSVFWEENRCGLCFYFSSRKELGLRSSMLLPFSFIFSVRINIGEG